MLYSRRCIGCGACMEACPQACIRPLEEAFVSDAQVCTRCGVCVQVCYSQARQLVGMEMNVPQVLAEIERDVAFYDESGGGVTFSGGEPLMQRNFLRELLRTCREREIHTVVDTSGFAAWEVLEGLRPYVNLFLYDLKLMSDERHRRFTGVSNTLILHNLQALSQLGHAIRLRVPVIPGINDDPDNLQRLGAFAAALPGKHPLDLLPYHAIATGKYRSLERDYRLSSLHTPGQDEMERIAAQLRSFGLVVQIGG